MPDPASNSKRASVPGRVLLMPAMKGIGHIETNPQDKGTKEEIVKKRGRGWDTKDCSRNQYMRDKIKEGK